MRPVIVALSAAIVWILATALCAQAQGGFEFRMGFNALASQIPEVAGEPLENEHYGPNGDALQQTSRGLMVWRKADNWTAFTDGTRSWLNGPEGLQDRPNNLRFVWEKEDTPASPPSGPRTYGMEVRAMDLESGGPGVAVKRLVAEIDSDWGNLWGWRATKPTTVYLFTGGYHMVVGIPSILGRTLSFDEARHYEANVPAFHTEDALTGGWAIVLNIATGMGTPDWETTTRANLARQYGYLMEREAAGLAGPNWYREGVARVCSDSKVPTDPSLKREISRVYEAKRKGTLPTLRRLYQDWGGFVSISTDYTEMACGLSFLSANVLADRAGRVSLLEVLRRTARGEDFEAALKAVTGYTLEKLDADVKAKL